MANSQVEIILEEIIKPSFPTPHDLRTLKHSLLDLHEGYGFVPLVFFYQSHPSLKFDDLRISQQLKQSLSETLPKFYPFAGRCNGNNNNFSIDCNDSGVLYVEAKVHADLSYAIQRSTSTDDLIQYLPPGTSQSTWTDGLTNEYQLAVQINFFKCGSIAIGVCLSHLVADMFTFLTFMNSWASKYNGTQIETIQPNFEMGYKLFPMPDQVEVPEEVPEFFTKQKTVMKRFVFDKETLEGMKKLVSSRSTCHNPTKVETVSAFIWKHIIDITNAKNPTKSVFGAFHAVDLRCRISQQPLSNAMGNFAILTMAQAELEDAKDYCNLVAPLRAAIRKDYNNLDLTTPNEPNTGYCMFSSWCKFPFYEVDYGWGKPYIVCNVAFPFKNGVILMDTKCGDGVEAWISMAEDEMELLPKEFLALENNDFSK
ncbi:hypothetical protein M9H77_12643 [Catharanthus roseus]|uniref:Uncharacterized protein n=1 Tax=Catharanthus roseus TaxID=4058 RepID=A0ACC0BI63_CATRO|nr:hypothetical protein M9H77_12643 [Catharanthus roseus]